MRILKKYANRRLYDTKTSSYVKLEDVQQMVVQFQPIQVIDIATDEDITELILLSIITNIESQKKHQKVLTRALLEQLIRMYSYDYSSVSPLGQYMENALKFYEDSLKNMAQPLDMWGNVLSGPYEMWQKAINTMIMPNTVREEGGQESQAPEKGQAEKPSAPTRAKAARPAAKAKKAAGKKSAARPVHPPSK